MENALAASSRFAATLQEGHELPSSDEDNEELSKGPASPTAAGVLT
jgi:hypothetical protein